MAEWLSMLKGSVGKCGVACVLVLIPAAMYVLSGVVAGAKGPYWLAENFDPEYAYLFNALNLINFRVPELVEHPGTTLHVMGAFVIKLLTLGKPSSEVTELVFADPEYYLTAINHTLRILNFVCLLALGAVCYVLTRSLVTALLIQSPLVWFAYNIEVLSRVSPEPLLLFVTTGLVGFILVVIERPALLSEKALVVSLSIISGFGIATKLTFVPILCLPLILLQNIRARALFLGGTLAAVLAFTLPILPRYHVLFSWTENLLVRSGHYGTGASTVVENFWPNLLTVLWYQPGLSVLVGVLAVSYTAMKFQLSRSLNHGHEGLRRVERVTLGVLAVAVVQFVAVAKHPGSLAYLMPALGLSGLMMALVYLILKGTRLPLEAIRIGIGLLLVGGLINIGIGQWKKVELSLADYHERRIEAAYFEGLREHEFGDCLQVFHYRASSIAYAEHFGAEWSGARFYGPRIESRYGPRTFFYQVWTHRLFASTGEQVDLQRVLREAGGCVIFHGSPFNGEYARFHPAISFHDQCGGKREALYVIGRKCPRSVKAGMPS